MNYIFNNLQQQVSLLIPSERQKLERICNQIAYEEGVRIEDWDHEWGKYHLFDSDARLNKALSILNQAPKEPISKDYILEKFQKLKEGLDNRYPELKIYSFDDEEFRSRAFKSQEIFFSLFPGDFTDKEINQFNYFNSIVSELVIGDYNLTNARLILDVLLKRESRHPTVTDLTHHSALKEIEMTAKRQIGCHSLCRGDESVCKDIFIIPSSENKKGKFKPLTNKEAMKEVYAAHCDRIFGFGMTAPTQLLNLPRLSKRLNQIQQLFRAIISESRRRQDNVLFKGIMDRLRQAAFNLFHSEELPGEVRNAIFGEMYHLCGNQHQGDEHLGMNLFNDTEGQYSSYQHKNQAIQNYLESYAFRDHEQFFDRNGSIQIWANNCKRPYDFLANDDLGGKKLKTAPKTLVHLYALLEIIKGSMDCSSGNSLVIMDDQHSQVINFLDMDDERSMPLSANFWEFRMWQMGLPQCAEPFDRGTLLLFSDRALLNKLKKQQTSPQISSAAYQAQVKRVEKSMRIFSQELTKPHITLTPRELFFTLFGGREDYTNAKQRFNNDRTYEPHGIRISAIELFEFHLPEMGRGAWYTGDENEQRRIGNNMRELYYPELP